MTPKTSASFTRGKTLDQNNPTYIQMDELITGLTPVFIPNQMLGFFLK
jgi:hypothetical protein